MSVLPIIAEVIPLLAQRLGIQRLSYLCLFVRVSGPGCSCLWGSKSGAQRIVIQVARLA